MPLERLMDRFSEEEQSGEETSGDESTPDFGADESTQDGDREGNGAATPGTAPDGGGATAQNGGTDYRVEELEDHVEQNAEALENVERSQEEIAESVDEMNDTVRQLLGMYSQVTAAENPFVEDDGEGFGVVEELPDEEEPTESDPTADSPPPETEDETVSFDDLAATRESAEAGPESHQEAGTSLGGGETATEQSPATGATEGRGAATTFPADGTQSQTCLLPTLPQGYAAEVVVFEWLSMLVTTTGPAAALKALAYYEEVGWISGGVREHLDMALSGPDLDIHVDPNSPKELTAADHAESYAYIKQLRELEQMEVSFAE